MADFPSGVSAVDGLKTLQRVLIKGSETGGNNLVVSPSDMIQGQDNPQGSLLHLRGGNSQSGGNGGANVLVEGGTGDTTGNGGNLIVRGGAHGGSGTTGVIQLTNNGGADTVPIYSLISEGTNGITIFFFAGDRDPAGNVSALGAGDMYYRNDGTSFRSTASGTGNWIIQAAGVRRTLDSRSSPHTTPLASSGGGTATGTISVGTANGTMVFLLITASVSITPVDIEFFSDVAKTLPIFTNLAVDFSSPLAVRAPTFLMADDGTDLASNSIYYTITNDGGTDSTFDISMIVEGE